jgi:hypothetical protein
MTDSDDLLVIGTTTSLDFPVTFGAYQTENKGGGEIFITKFYMRNKMNLYGGWNLISIPTIQSDTNLGSVLSSIEGKYDAVQWFNISDTNDPWKDYHVTKVGFSNELNYVDHQKGFWVHMNVSGITQFVYQGSQPLVNQRVLLEPGWNMVGYPSFSYYNRTVGLNDLEFGLDVDCIQWYDAITKTWHFMASDDIFVPGRGYLIHSKMDISWEVPL